MSFTESLNDLFSVNGLIGLLTLSVLEVVLGIDNIIFVSIIAGRLEKERQRIAWNFGLGIAMLLRIGLLFSITWIMGMDKNPLFEVFGHAVTVRDLILFAGGVFLMVKTVSEIHAKIEGEEEGGGGEKKSSAFGMVLLQIILIDLVFSFDSILTAVGISDSLAVMVVSVVLSTVLMMLASRVVADFIEKHPTVKMLALAFLLMIAFLLILDSMHVEVPKEYVYSSMAFAFIVELLNMRVRRKSAKKVAEKKKEKAEESK